HGAVRIEECVIVVGDGRAPRRRADVRRPPNAGDIARFRIDPDVVGNVALLEEVRNENGRIEPRWIAEVVCDAIALGSDAYRHFLGRFLCCRWSTAAHTIVVRLTSKRLSPGTYALSSGDDVQ